MDDEQARLTYRNFIDEMVAVARPSVRVDRIAAHGHTERTNHAALPLDSEEALRREFCRSLGAEQRVILAALLADEREAAVHDVLAFLEWAVLTERLDITGADGSFSGKAEETMHGDFVSRAAGDEWPG